MEQNINPSIQRRDFPRYYTNQPFLIEITSTKNLIQTKGKTVNISKHGLCVRLDKEISVAERVDLNISLDENRNLNNKARVIWSDPKLALYGIDMTEYKETVPDYWDGYLAGMKIVEVERRIKRERREKREVKNHDTRKSERRLEYPFFAKLKKMKMYQDLIKADNFSYLREIESGSENIVIVNGEKLINLCSNNYLGMTTHPKVIDEGVIALKKYGVGSGGARFVGGTMDLHNELERRLARFKGGEDCVIFSTGYTMNIATISLLANQNDYLVVDKKAHASIIDGCKLSGANTIFYKHNDMNDLEKILKKLGTEKSKMIITEGVFSMDGDISSLDEIYKLGEKYNAPVMIDDAHGSGVLGKNGSGTASHFGLEGKISVIAGTLSKAFGCVGGYVVANKEIIRCLKHYSRGFVFTTSLPPTVIASLIKVVDVFETEPEWQEKLWENIKYIRRSLLQLGFKLTDTNSAIIPVILGEDKFAHLFVKRLQEEGIFVSPAAYPAVPKNEARLRVSLMATHTRLQLEIFVSTMEKLGKEYKII